MRVASFPEAEVPLDLRQHVIALQQQAWPGPDPDDTSAWHDPSLGPLSVLLLDGEGRARSALDILSTTISHRGAAYDVSGISAMVTDTECRGLGYGRRLAQAALESMRSGAADLGLFTCDRDLQHFYRSGRWSCLAESVLVGGTPESPYPSDQFDKVVMASFFSPRARSAADGFVQARIELFPGEIDRLW